MKKILILALALMLTAVCLLSCGGSETTPGGTTPDSPSDAAPGDVVDGKLILFKDGKTVYDVVYSFGASNNSDFKAALTELRAAIRETCGVQEYTQTYDIDREPGEFEILLGKTNRPESAVFEGLSDKTQMNIRVVGKKILIGGADEVAAAQAIRYFIEKYLVVENGVVSIPADTDETLHLDLGTSLETGKTYLAMANDYYNSFNRVYFHGNWVQGSGWWDAAEILETYVDAYEATGNATVKSRMLTYARAFMARNHSDWSYNEYNDDIMWACIAFCRISILTGDNSYYESAKKNFDVVYERALDTRLGGGLYWKSPENQTKNSCVNCPASIAACLIGTISGDETYWEYAKTLMAWEVKEMFVRTSGQVYDAYPLSGQKNKWASTYNQGTFIGACTLLVGHYTEEKDTYLGYAAKAADYAMKRLTKSGILDNGEGEAKYSNRDLIGFKGILARWLYRYAKATQNLDILAFLQKNADAAYTNRNASGLCRTNWYEKTPDLAETMTEEDEDGNLQLKYAVFGMSTAMSILYNCLPWWD